MEGVPTQLFVEPHIFARSRATRLLPVSNMSSGERKTNRSEEDDKDETVLPRNKNDKGKRLIESDPRRTSDSTSSFSSSSSSSCSSSDSLSAGSLFLSCSERVVLLLFYLIFTSMRGASACAAP